MAQVSDHNMLGWHILGPSKSLRYGDLRIVTLGDRLETLRDDPIGVCNNGMHASSRIIDCLLYSPHTVFCRVLVENEIITTDDKFAGRYRTVLKWTTQTDGTNAIEQFRNYLLDRARRIVTKLEARQNHVDFFASIANQRGYSNEVVWKLAHSLSFPASSPLTSELAMSSYSRVLSRYVIPLLSRTGESKWDTIQNTSQQSL